MNHLRAIPAWTLVAIAFRPTTYRDNIMLGAQLDLLSLIPSTDSESDDGMVLRVPVHCMLTYATKPLHILDTS